MRLLIIRHADPDYSIDSLTETGWREASILSQRLTREKIDHFYVSPLGRARDTARDTMKLFGREAIVLDWLQEFPPRILRPDADGARKVSWDWLPQDWTADERLFDKDRWKENEILREAGVGEVYDQVCRGLDGLLAEHGYVRDGHLYRVENANTETIALFCHFGLESVLLSHLMNCSPYILWQGFAAAPTSVSTLYTEERREGKAYFRAAALGDISHLYAAGEPPSFSARFCECYSNFDERHD